MGYIGLGMSYMGAGEAMDTEAIVMFFPTVYTGTGYNNRWHEVYFKIFIDHLKRQNQAVRPASTP